MYFFTNLFMFVPVVDDLLIVLQVYFSYFVGTINAHKYIIKIFVYFPCGILIWFLLLVHCVTSIQLAVWCLCALSRHSLFSRDVHSAPPNPTAACCWSLPTHCDLLLFSTKYLSKGNFSIMPKDKRNEAVTEIDHVDRGITSITQIPNICE